MSYEIKILSDEEFDKLPFKHAKTALGAADAKTSIAYVRRTGIPALDKRTIEHEFDEMLQRVSPHEEDGIRYKSGIFGSRRDSFLNKVFRPLLAVAAVIPGPHQPFAIAANIATTGSDIATRGFRPTDLLALAGPATGALKGFGAAAEGASFGSKLASAGKGALGIGSKAATAAGAATPIGAKTVTVPGVGSNIPVGAAKSIANATTTSSLGALGKFAVSSATNAASNRLLSAGAGKQGGLSSLQGVLPGGSGGQSGALARFSGIKNIGDLTAPSLTEADLTPGLNAIDINAANRRNNVFQTFRGSTVEGNSGFAKQLGNIEVGTQREKETFLNEAETANNRKFQRKQLMKVNNLSSKQFDTFLNLAKTGSDAAIRSKVNQDPNEFREVFKGF